MKIEQKKVGTVDVFKPIGAIVDQDAEKFTRTLLDRLDADNARVVLLLDDTPYIDSVALEGLLKASEELADRASRLTLAGVTHTCREILELTGLAERCRFFNDVGDAVKSFL
jgi:anti-anti-sigma factor